MDGIDRKELPAADLKREEYLKKHGSFLYCADRGTLCVHMDGMWMTGCERDECILDDPEYQRLQERIEENRRRNEAEHRRQRKAEKHDPPAPIRDQRNRIQSYIEKETAEIHRIEEESREAFRQNRPNRGEQLLNRARTRRQELKAWQQKNGA